MALNLIGLAASLAILLAYGRSVYVGDSNVFHWANAVLWLPVAVPSVLAGVWGAALLTTSFGLIGTYALLTEHLEGHHDSTLNPNVNIEFLLRMGDGSEHTVFNPDPSLLIPRENSLDTKRIDGVQ